VRQLLVHCFVCEEAWSPLQLDVVSRSSVFRSVQDRLRRAGPKMSVVCAGAAEDVAKCI
jgi:hypothetical protein